MRRPRFSSSSSRRGSALLAVMWLSIALSAIAFTLSRSVRTELERAAANVDSTRAYFLAQGAIQRAMMRMMTAGQPGGAAGQSRGFQPGQRFMRFNFSTGRVEVEIIGESGKVDVNQASPEMMAQVLAACGLDPPQAVTLAVRIAEARRRSPWASLTPQSTKNLTPAPSLSLAGASLEELEQLLMAPGVTPELLYGEYRRNSQGQLVRRGGLIHHFTVWGGGRIDVNYASEEVLRAAGVPAPVVESIVRTRRLRPLGNQDLGLAELAAQTGEFRVGLGGGSRAYTLRAKATLNNGRAVRTVSALVKRGEKPEDPPIRVLRWYDTDF